MVRPDPTMGDFPNIQAAVDAAASGDVVELLPGTFVGPGNRDVDFLGKAIAIRSASGVPETTVIDCEGASGAPHRGVVFETNEDEQSVLAGVTVKNGYVGSGSGGAIRLMNASPTIDDCIFEDNEADVYGGALSCLGFDTQPILTDCVFRDNRSYLGGAVFLSAGSAASVARCSFHGNAAWAGGVLYM